MLVDRILSSTERAIVEIADRLGCLCAYRVPVIPEYWMLVAYNMWSCKCLVVFSYQKSIGVNHTGSVYFPGSFAIDSTKHGFLHGRLLRIWRKPCLLQICFERECSLSAEV
jgi:hypothetical protein